MNSNRISFGGSNFSVTGSHTYAQAGTYTVQVTIAHEQVLTTVQTVMVVYNNPTVVNTRNMLPRSPLLNV